MTSDVWMYPGGGDEWSTFDIIGYKVEATDGDIGKVDEKSNEVGADYIVVDTGPWIFGKKVMLPAGLISRGVHQRTVHVDRTKDEIKNSPEFDETTYREATYRDKLGHYYDRPV